MTLKEFADKYNVDAQELFDILIFEKFPIATINDEVDTVICQYLIETTGIKQKKNLLSQRVIKTNTIKKYIKKKTTRETMTTTKNNKLS